MKKGPQEIIRAISEATQDRWAGGLLTPAGTRFISVYFCASVFCKPLMRNLLKVNKHENSDRGSERRPCQPMLIFERTVPREPVVSKIVFQDPNLKTQDLAQLPVSACVRFLRWLVTGLLFIRNSHNNSNYQQQRVII